MKFIHSSDLQIGKAFGTFAPETATVLQDARQAVVRTLGELAVKNGASAVLIRHLIAPSRLVATGAAAWLADAPGLKGRTRHRAVGTEHAAVAGLRFQLCIATGAFIKKLTGFGQHDLRFR